MSIIDIVQYPDKRLQRIGQKVEVFDKTIHKVIDDMFETHYSTRNCAALAATQLAFSNPWHITVIDFSAEKNQPLCLVNPEIFYMEGEQYEYEGCMSVYPEYLHEKVKRAYKIKVRAFDRDGKPFEMEAEDFMAKCIQHEVDHLNGKIYLAHLSKLKRSRIEKRINKLISS